MEVFTNKYFHTVSLKIMHHKIIKTVLLFTVFFLCINSFAQEIYIGTTMGFADYLEHECGIVYKEDGVPKDPFQSLAGHGANIVRFRIDNPPYSSSYSEGKELYFRNKDNVKTGMHRAQDAGLQTLLTFSYVSCALEDASRLNNYVAPLDWQPVAGDLDKLIDSVYKFTFDILDEYCSEGIVPALVSIGNESSWYRLMPNIPEADFPAYDPARSAALHNAGSKAVRDIAQKYNAGIKICYHMGGPSSSKWWLENHSKYNPDFDILGISLYYEWTGDNFGGYPGLGAFVAGIESKYGKDVMVMETAQLFRLGGNDGHVDILGASNIPPGYPNPPTTDTQKRYLTDISREVIDNGGLGVIAWGGEWLGCNCYIYADQWGKGSSWESKAFWDFSNNLHDGVNWMQDVSKMYSNHAGEIAKDDFIKIYPNPIINNILNINANIPGKINIFVKDIYGRQVYSDCLLNGISNSKSLNLNSLGRGVYIVNISRVDSHENYSKRIVIN